MSRVYPFPEVSRCPVGSEVLWGGHWCIVRAARGMSRTVVYEIDEPLAGAGLLPPLPFHGADPYPLVCRPTVIEEVVTVDVRELVELRPANDFRPRQGVVLSFAAPRAPTAAQDEPAQ